MHAWVRFLLSSRCGAVFSSALLLWFGVACAGAQITPVGASVPARGTLQMGGLLNGHALTGGYWYVNGTGQKGGIDQATGIYIAPYWAPTPNVVTVGYYAAGQHVETAVTVTNPVPVINGLSVSSIYNASTPVVIAGSGFAPGATVLVNGTTVPSTYIGQDRISLTLNVPTTTTGNIAITVQNPAPGAASATIQVPATFSTTHVLPAQTQVRAQGTQQFSVTVDGQVPTGGYWYTNGTGDVGGVDQAGLYHGPYAVPAATTVKIGYYLKGRNIETTAQIVNPAPKPDSTSVKLITLMSTEMAIHGTGFLPGTVVYVQGVAVPTSYFSNAWIGVNVKLTTAQTGAIALVVKNPGPGASSGTISVPSSFPGLGAVSPSTTVPGWQTFQITGTGFTSNTAVLMDGRPMKTTMNSATSLTATGYLPPWGTNSRTTITVQPSLGSVTTGTTDVPITSPALSYDVAARFATQAALGPRPGMVEHIQQVGLKGFLNEQFQQPGVTYNPAVLPRYTFIQYAVGSNSVLRMRVAMALQSFIANQGITEEYKSYAPWEQTLETDAFGNFRQLMTDIVSNARFADFLNLPGNIASTNGTSHPNQNFPRELMQLFTMGTSMLNDDGTVQLDASGRPIASYDQDTVDDLSRAFTGWNFGPLKDPSFTAYNIDWSQPLVAQNQYHDYGAKTLFGTVHLPGGQDAATDRKMALDAIFQHANVPPFISFRLIEQLVKSNPSPAYVKRISAVFKNDGKGVRGNLQAVVQAILLDPEARAGDTAAITESDGLLQDPIMWQSFLENVLQQTTWDGEPIAVPAYLGQPWWHPLSVFSYYPAQFAIPGTTINSPQYALMNNLTQQHRSQLTYAVITGGAFGFHNMYQANSWLFQAFTTLPDLVDGLNHQLFHGTMPPAVQNAILSYCSGISDHRQQFSAAIFLALNSDSYNVVH